MTKSIEIHDVLLKRSRIDRFGGRLYCLGPNYGRISFASQQTRALNLVWALSKAGRIKPGTLVGVVGAGVSGVTTAFALRAYKCAVRIFDRGARPLHRQAATTHRHVHPTINWWPSDGELLPTNELPFLHWHASQCSDVISTLGKEWARLEKSSGKDLKFYSEENVLDIVSIPADSGKLTITTDKNQYGKIDVIIIASGFGEEKSHGDLQSTSYWRPDWLEDTKNSNPKIKKFIVSGCGDGGLIDALRLAFDFDFGQLSFRVAESLSEITLVTKRLADIEQKSATKDWKIAAAGYDETAKIIATNRKCRATKQLLENAITMKTNRIMLLSRSGESPYETSAAPIHKLMIAYAKYKGILEYQKGELVVSADGTTLRAGSKTFNKAEVLSVVRHGAEPFDGQIVIPVEWAGLQSASLESAEYDFKRAWADDETFPVPEGWRCRAMSKAEFIEQQRPLAAAALNYLGSKTAWVQAEASRYKVFDHNISYRPTTLFGIDVYYEDQDQLPEAVGLE